MTRERHEYVFDVKLAAVCRVTARSADEAERRMRTELADAQIRFARGCTPKDVRLANGTLDDVSPLLLEVDGQEF